MDADLVRAAAALRWARPDLTAELADHVLEEASAAGQQDRWLDAAGWAVHARAATGDGRETACGVLAALTRWGSDALTGAAAGRLRVELAMVAAGAGEVESARRFLTGVQADGDPELTADLLCAHARCAVEDAPDEVAAALDSADAAWAAVGGTAGQLGGASVALVRAVVERRAGRPAVAVDHAADGLARLERARAGSGTASGHLAAALAAEWISALLDAGRVAEAREGCGALLPRLSEQARPTRQLALLRLTVTRALAAQDATADTAELLAQAAEDAAGSDVPDLEAVCRTALGALHEQAGRLDVALAALQLAVDAERRDRGRSRRFLAALAELPADLPVEPTPEREQPRRHRERPGAPGVRAGLAATATTSTEATTVLPAITRGDRKLRENRGEEQESPKSRFERLLEEPAPAEEPSSAWAAVPWNGSAGDSPIGDLLIRGFHTGAAEPSENGSGRRNGKSVDGPARREEPATSSGWMPKLDADRAGDEQASRRRGRSADADRRRSRRAREEQAAPPRHSESTRYPDDDAAAQERSARSRRSRHGDDEPADRSGGRTARGRHGRSALADPEGSEGRSRSARSGGGAQRRQEPATTTDAWTPGSDLPDSDRYGSDRYGSDRYGSDRYGEAVPAAAVTSSGPSDESDGWLQSALAELDRALSGIGVGGPARIDEPAPSDDGCAVVVDIARDGRRFAGPRAAAVVHAVADLLADRLPAGTRSRFGDSDALVVTRAGWSRPDATDWMHRTLPGLLDGFVAPEELPGAQLRVAVHDADGPVGAQILQPLTPAGRERASVDPAADGTSGTSEVRGQKYRAAARAGRPERGARSRREHGAEHGVEPTGAVEPLESARWPFSGDVLASDPDPMDDIRPQGADPVPPAAPAREDAGTRGRRHRADTPERGRGSHEPEKPSGTGRAARRRSADNASSTGSNGTGSNGTGSNGTGSNGAGPANGTGAEVGSGSRAKGARGTATEQVTASQGGQEASGREADRAESTEGLGIADLLAGALAAYRGI